jgi:4,5-DOPA dioxygenase extradiol
LPSLAVGITNTVSEGNTKRETQNTKRKTNNMQTPNKMPVLFVGHGNPMNAIVDNEFTKSWHEIGASIPNPTSILCISAHWETPGTKLTAMSNPNTIHDFGGFPRSLYEVQYPAAGNPELATQIKNQIKLSEIGLDYSDWGLDHGAWSVIKHLYPKANIPVVQMSLNQNQAPKYHYELSKELSFLRKNGVLIIASGNLVHNLRMVDWQNENTAYDWALEANEQMKKWILNDNHQSLIDFNKQGKAFELAIPTAEHFLPLLYTLGLKDKTDSINFFTDKFVMGSLSMTGLQIG